MASVDINSIPYSAPLSIAEPSWFWTRRASYRGANSTFIRPAAMPPRNTDLTNKWVIITGSNNGIGREAALQFAAWGANIILGCRDNTPPHETHAEVVVEQCLLEARKAGKKISVEHWHIDMADLKSVEAFGKRWLDTGRPLDLLCNNAGVGSSPGGTEVFKTKDGFEFVHQVSPSSPLLTPLRIACTDARAISELTTHQINFLSHVLLTLRLLPSLAKASTPRVICTTSCFHYFGKYDVANWNGELPGSSGLEGVQYYMNNKLYLQCWLTELQHRLLKNEKYKHITVNGVHPGYVNSGIWTLNKNGLWLKEYLLQSMAWVMAINPQQGSLCIVNAATSIDAGPDPKVQGVGVEGGKGGGRYFNRIWEDEAMPHTRDADARLRVWRKANDELGLEAKGLLEGVGLKAI
ncbi:hypothetical protein MRB53_041192 [Persea americana]|nr:hypothetical protein MRB53_041192 [Persea americana]